MKLFYLTSMKYPSVMTNRLQTEYMFNAFTEKLGRDFTFSIASGGEEFDLDNLIELGNVSGPMMAWRAFKYIQNNDIDVVYCREEVMVTYLALIYKILFFVKRPKIVFEVHHYPRTFRHKFALRNSDMFVSITKSLADMLDKETIVAPDAVDIKLFDIDISKEEARTKLGIDIDKKIAMYTGHVYKWKGIDTLIKASILLNDEYEVYVVGGKDNHIERLKEELDCSRVNFVGMVSHEDVPLWLKAADVLVLPNTAKDEISNYFTSPLKLFEYMVSKRPIVASDIPSIREVLNEDNSILFQADDNNDLAKKIKESFEVDTTKMVNIAYDDVSSMTWDNRADLIIRYIQEHVK